jgi:hypothetical protein
MNPATYLSIGAGLALLAAAWQRIRAILSDLSGFFVVHYDISNYMDNAAISTLGYLLTNYKHRRLGSRSFFAGRLFINSLQKRWPVLFEYYVGNMLFWSGCWPFLVRVSCWPTAQMALTVHYVRGTVDMASIVRAAIEFNAKSAEASLKIFDKGRFFIQRMTGDGNRGPRPISQNTDAKKAVSSSSDNPSKAIEATASSLTIETIRAMRLLHWSIDDIQLSTVYRVDSALDQLSASVRIEEAIQDVRRWCQSREWYSERGIHWRYGLGLVGEPGNGKTSLVLALGYDFGMPIMQFDLSSMSNKDFLENWGQLLHHAPCIALFEDIESVFHGRKNVAGEQGGGLTFDCFLNALGGVDIANGILTVITTNKPDALDPALVRPGRIDRLVTIEAPTVEGYRKIATRILCGAPGLIDDLLDTINDGESAASFTNRCRLVALDAYWDRDNKNIFVTEDGTDDRHLQGSSDVGCSCTGETVDLVCR